MLNTELGGVVVGRQVSVAYVARAETAEDLATSALTTVWWGASIEFHCRSLQ